VLERFQLIKHIHPALPAIDAEEWPTLDEDVEVELTSEDADRPIENALLASGGEGWRADGPGPQTIRLSWASPITIRRIRLIFEEHGKARTQEFVLRAQTRDGMREIVRQQFTFSPPGTTAEREDYFTSLHGVAGLELVIVPAIDGAAAVATLREWRLA